jgi:hypothetical protein
MHDDTFNARWFSGFDSSLSVDFQNESYTTNQPIRLYSVIVALLYLSESTLFSSKGYGIAWEHLEQRQVMGLVDSIAVEA